MGRGRKIGKGKGEWEEEKWGKGKKKGEGKEKEKGKKKRKKKKKGKKGKEKWKERKEKLDAWTNGHSGDFILCSMLLHCSGQTTSHILAYNYLINYLVYERLTCQHVSTDSCKYRENECDSRE